jgi:hypothetical protein
LQKYRLILTDAIATLQNETLFQIISNDLTFILEANFFDFDLFRVNDPNKATQQWQGAGKSGILVVYAAPTLPTEDQDFLSSVLNAVKLTPLEEHIFLLPCPAGAHWPLSRICREHAIHTVFLFGLDPAQLGIRAQLPPYAFTQLGDLSLLLAHPLGTIRTEREANKNEKAGALWQALKAKFL